MCQWKSELWATGIYRIANGKPVLCTKKGAKNENIPVRLS